MTNLCVTYDFCSTCNVTHANVFAEPSSMSLSKYQCRLCGLEESKSRRRLLHTAGKHIVPIFVRFLEETFDVSEHF